MVTERPPKKSRAKTSFGKAARRAALVGAFGVAVMGGVQDNRPASVHANPASVDTVAINTPLLPQQPAPPPDPLKDIFNTKGLPYDQQVFQFNILPADAASLSTRLAAMTEQQRLEFYKQRFCFTAGERPSGTSQQDLFTAFESLSRLNFLGKPLVDLADTNDLSMCDLAHMPSGVAAQYMPNSEVIASGPFSTPEERVLKLAHEITHAAQDKNGLLNYNYSWDIDSRVRRNLSVEAAALTSEFMVAYEAKLAGDNSYWNLLQTHFAGTTYNDKATYTLIETTYQAAITAGATQNEALRQAGAAVWLRVFESDDWRNFYLNGELSNYLRDIDAGHFRDEHTISHNQFGQDQVDKAGKVGTLASFTQGDVFPDVNGLLARNQKMQWVYQVAEIARMRQMEGAGAHTTSDYLRTQAQAANNPYLSLDMSAVWQKVNEESFGHSFRYIYEVMDEMLKPAVPAPLPAVPPLTASQPLRPAA